jgi:hypothetical protein
MPEPLKPCSPSELWTSVPGFEERYDVSNQGRIRCWFTGGGFSLKTPRIKQPSRDKDGYLCVTLYERSKSKPKRFRISRLILTVFRGNPPSTRHEASHLDGNKANNSLENLAWETRQENEDRKEIHGTRSRGETSGTAKLDENKIREIRIRRTAGEKLEDLAREFNVTGANISSIARRKTWQRTA